MPANNPLPHEQHRAFDEFRTDDEGGLHAPPGLTGWRKAWWWFDFVILVKLARLRFIAVLAVIGVVITQWDLLAAYYDKWTRPATAGAGPHTGDAEWFCPMHPAVIRDNPKDKCPICFMPLSKRRKGEQQAVALPAGVVTRVQLSPYRVVLAGVQTAKVAYRPLSKEINAVGYVEFNERGQRTVSARVNGRIDKLYVNETGQMVAKGDDLALLYSPELVVSEQNLLDSRRPGAGVDLISASKRLELLGIDSDQIDEILHRGKPSLHLKIRSPSDGHVIKKYVREGQYVQEGMPLYDVADLSSVWIQAQVYEDDLEFLPTDQQSHQSVSEADRLPVVATTRAFADEPFYGTLAFIYPHVDQDTRTVSVRFELDNPGHKLRPGSTATVTIKVSPQKLPMFHRIADGGGTAKDMLAEGRVLAVPEASVIDTGSQTIVYRETTPGVFEGVLVKLGPRMSGPHNGSWYPVLSGLNAGDEVVASGSFLVDAETRLNPAAGSIYFGGSGGPKTGSNATTVRPSTPDDETAKLAAEPAQKPAGKDAKIAAALAKLSEADRKIAEQQKFCAVLGESSRLGSMGVPVKVMIEGQSVFVCCAGCREDALKDPQATLSRTQKFKDAKASK